MTASQIRDALAAIFGGTTALESLLVEAGVTTDAASVENEEPESTTEETQAASVTDTEETAPTQRELLRASLSKFDAFMTGR